MLEKILEEYDEEFFRKLEPVLEEIRTKSKALANNLLDCIIKLKNSERYIKAQKNKKAAIQDSELEGEEFEIFRKYVRLLRSCTIMCGHECSGRFKILFWDFFAGKRLELAVNAKI